MDPSNASHPADAANTAAATPPDPTNKRPTPADRTDGVPTLKRRKPKDMSDLLPAVPRGDAPKGLIPPSIFERYRVAGSAPAAPHAVAPAEDGRMCVFVKTPSGLEHLVQEEAGAALGPLLRDCAAVQGNVYLDLAVGAEEFPAAARAVLSLRTIESAFLLVLCGDGIAEDAATAEQLLRRWAAAADWRRWYALWAAATGCGTRFEDVTFRCTGKRLGDQQWTSVDAQRWFGGGMEERTRWKVQMKDCAVEAIPAVERGKLVLSVRLSPAEGLGRRNIVHAGHTTLRGCIAHCLLRCARVAPGDVVVDPMCGSASIPVELAVSQRHRRLPRTHNVCGDVGLSVMPMAVANLRHCGLGPAVDVMQLDCEALPFRDGALDVVVADLPFGKRIGSYAGVREFYPVAFRELARVTRPGTGRAVVLTHQYKWAVRACTGMAPAMWTVADFVRMNHGGLPCAIITVRRTATRFPGDVSPEGAPEGAELDPPAAESPV